MCLGVLTQILHLFLGQSAASGDRNLLFFSGPEVFRGDVQNSVCVDVESHLHLRNTAWGRRDTVQMKSSQRLIVSGHRSFALENLNFYPRLIVAVGRKDLLLPRRDR